MQVVLALGVELARRDVEAEIDVLARLEAGLLDRLKQAVERCNVRRQVRRKAAFVTDRGAELAAVQHLLQRVKDFGTVTQRFGKTRRTEDRKSTRLNSSH